MARAQQRPLSHTVEEAPSPQCSLEFSVLSMYLRHPGSYPHLLLPEKTVPLSTPVFRPPAWEPGKHKPMRSTGELTPRAPGGCRPAVADTDLGSPDPTARWECCKHTEFSSRLHQPLSQLQRTDLYKTADLGATYTQ